MTVATMTPYQKPPVSIPPYPYYKVSAFLNTSQFDTAAELQALADGQMTSNVTNDTITLNDGGDKYMYLFSPVSNGTIDFTDLSTNIVGGWDGASWPDQDIGMTNGPIIVSLDFGVGAEDWYVYRTDFAGIGNKTWRLKYNR